MPELLLEIGLEEIPARMIAAAQAELARRVEALLTRHRLGGSSVASYSTPRRLAVCVEGVLAGVSGLAVEISGLSGLTSVGDRIALSARGRADILAEIVGYGSTADAFRITDQHPEGEAPSPP